MPGPRGEARVLIRIIKSSAIRFGIQAGRRCVVDNQVAEELLHQLGESLESLETQVGALLEFLKDTRLVSDDQLAPYLKRASDASSVRWRATRVRLEHVFAMAAEKDSQRAKQAEERIETQPQKQMEERGSGGSGSAARSENTRKQASEGDKSSDAKSAAHGRSDKPGESNSERKRGVP